jgi:hypothetical protein
MHLLPSSQEFAQVRSASSGLTPRPCNPAQVHARAASGRAAAGPPAAARLDGELGGFEAGTRGTTQDRYYLGLIGYSARIRRTEHADSFGQDIKLLQVAKGSGHHQVDIGGGTLATCVMI